MPVKVKVNYSGIEEHIREVTMKKVDEHIRGSLIITAPDMENRRDDGIEDIRIELLGRLYIVRRAPDGEYKIHKGEIDK